MIRHPYGPDELDRTDPELDGLAEQLQDYASGQRSSPPVDLAARIHAAVDAEPDPAVGWWARFSGSMASWGVPARGLAAAAVVTSGDRGGARDRQPRRSRARFEQRGHDAEPIGRRQPEPEPVADDQPDPVPDAEPEPIADAERLTESSADTRADAVRRRWRERNPGAVRVRQQRPWRGRRRQQRSRRRRRAAPAASAPGAARTCAGRTRSQAPARVRSASGEPGSHAPPWSTGSRCRSPTRRRSRIERRSSAHPSTNTNGSSRLSASASTWAVSADAMPRPPCGGRTASGASERTSPRTAKASSSKPIRLTST